MAPILLGIAICRHCRADAIATPDPHELNFDMSMVHHGRGSVRRGLVTAVRE
jgi:hypothetical protein